MISKKLTSIQFLRALAATVVVFGHAQTEAHQANQSFHGFSFDFGIGVDIFFIISGFIMVITSQKLYGKTSAPWTFLRKRFIRIVPLYWFYTSAMVLAIFLFPSQLDSAQFDILNLISSYLFLPYEVSEGRYFPILALGWTLNYEMFFYAVFASTLVLPAARGLATTLVILVAFVFAGALLPLNGMPFLPFWTNPIILEFLAGAICGHVYLRIGKMPSIPLMLLFVALSAAAYALLDDRTDIRAVYNGIPSLFLFIAFAFFINRNWESRLEGVSKWVGDSSYSLYLVHPFVLAVVKMAWRKFDFDFNYAWAYIWIASLTCIPVAIISYRILEQTTLRFFERKTQEPVQKG